jgi:16S rRNA (uracil1498-N3)-methyltransferase
MHRFLLKDFKKEKERVRLLNLSQIYQIENVLKLKPSEKIIVFDETGLEITIKLETISTKEITGQILKEEKVNRELPFKINLYQALLKHDKFDWFLKEATGLGVNKFIPIITERTIVRKISNNKLRRWQKIIEEAVEQSGRCQIPTIEKIISFKEAIKRSSAELRLVGEPSSQKILREVLPLRPPEEIDVFIGPEGGFSKKEIRIIKNNSFELFNFGPRILRAEAFGLVVMAAIIHHYF